MKTKFYVPLIFVSLMAFAGLARADMIATLSGCASCFGTVYTLSSDGVNYGTPGGNDIYNFTLTVDATGTTGRATVASVAIGIASTGDWVSGSVSDPYGWTEVLGGLSASGCNGSGAFDCAQGTPLAVGTSSSIYTFDFTETLLPGAPLQSSAGIKALFLNAAGQQRGITSDDATFTTTITHHQGNVPEPATLALLGLGLAGIGVGRRRKN